MLLQCVLIARQVPLFPLMANEFPCSSLLSRVCCCSRLHRLHHTSRGRRGIVPTGAFDWLSKKANRSGLFWEELFAGGGYSCSWRFCFVLFWRNRPFLPCSFVLLGPPACAPLSGGRYTMYTRWQPCSRCSSASCQTRWCPRLTTTPCWRPAPRGSRSSWTPRSSASGSSRQ